MKTSKTILLLIVIQAIASCGGGSGSTPTTPTTPPVQLAMFTDSVSGFSTSDIRDVQDQIVRFDLANNALIWVATGRSFSGYPVRGNFIRADKAFQVRFGIQNGERRAYFTETVAETICDIDVTAGSSRSRRQTCVYPAPSGQTGTTIR